MAVTEQQVWQPYFVFHLDTVSIFHTRLYFESSAWVQKGQTGTFPLGEHLMGEGRGGDEQSKACPPPAPVRAEWPGRMGHPDAELTSPIASQIDLHAFIAQALCLEGKTTMELADLQVLTVTPLRMARLTTLASLLYIWLFYRNVPHDLFIL